MKKHIIKILMLSILFLLIYYTKSYCVESGTVRMQVIDNNTPWVNINVSDSYEECESLNSATSTLGTTALKAHLTTDADWSAMAIFSVSQYGGQTSNTPTWTNNNNSGIKNIGGLTQTTGIVDSADKNTSFLSGLFNNDGSIKKYVHKWSFNRATNNFVSFSDSGTYQWLGNDFDWGNSKGDPVSLKNGLFGGTFGSNRSGVNKAFSNGGPWDSVSFRPVIWN